MNLANVKYFNFFKEIGNVPQSVVDLFLLHKSCDCANIENFLSVDTIGIVPERSINFCKKKHANTSEIN